MRKSLIALMVLPVVALAQGPNKNPPQTGSAGQPGQPDPAKVEKRMRLARTLGLAEVLDLDTAQALKLGDTLARFDDKRKPVRKQIQDATDVLRNAARGVGNKPNAAEVDGAINKLLDGRAQLQAIDKEMLQAITKDLAPEQKARAALFLGRFRDRIERFMWMMHGGGGMGGAGNGSGMMRPGMMMDHQGQQGMRMGPGGDQDHLAARRAGGRHGYDDGGFDDPPPFADDVD